MGETKIEWATHTWNPVRGCSRISPGCLNCYAEKIAGRFSGPGGTFEGFAIMKNGDARWTGKVGPIDDKLLEPLRWRKPRRVFVNSMSDLFHEALPDEAIDRVFAVMALCPNQTFMILTKRAERMAKYFRSAADLRDRWSETMLDQRVFGPDARRSVLGNPSRAGLAEGIRKGWRPVELANVWLGVSTENQQYADERIPWLLKTPAAVRFVSYEPALGPVDFTAIRERLRGESYEISSALHGTDEMNLGMGRARLDWVISGGESGPGARPAHPDWFRSVRDQCAAAGVPFFFKQWGEQVALDHLPILRDPITGRLNRFADGTRTAFPDGTIMVKTGKKSAGRLLDGVEHNGFPQ